MTFNNLGRMYNGVFRDPISTHYLPSRAYPPVDVSSIGSQLEQIEESLRQMLVPTLGQLRSCSAVIPRSRF
jgi:hypothetical protein